MNYYYLYFGSKGIQMNLKYQRAGVVGQGDDYECPVECLNVLCTSQHPS